MEGIPTGGCLMLVAVADTHTVIWYIFGDERLSVNAKAFIEKAAKAGDQIGVSSITLAELVYLVEKRRLPLGAFHRLLSALDSPDSVLVEVTFNRHIAETLLQVNRSIIPDLPDRIIAATALYLGVPVISRDRKIRLSNVATIW